MTEQRAHWRLETDKNQVAWLTLDQQGSGTNTLGTEVMGQLDARLAEIERARPKALVIRSAKDSGFIAGADISEFTGFADAEQAYRLVRTGQQVFDRIEALSMPTAAAIQGFALGGGLELALACDYRVGADDGRLNLGLPEVLLGIHPGFGGTVRTPRLIGAPAALDLMLTGRSLRGDAALKLGLIDRLVPREALDTAAREIVLAAPPPKRAPLMLRLLGLPLLRSFVAAQTRKQVARRANPAHYPAPYAIINLFARHGALGAAAYEAEARSIAALFSSESSRNLVRVFFLQNRLKALGGKGARKFNHVHVVGAGVMGGDIAAWCASRGLTVTLQDREMKYVEPALARAREFFGKRAQDPKKSAEMAARLTADVEGAGAARADIVIEAIFENADAKRALYAKLEPAMKPGALLATNTSSIMLEELSRELADPGRLVGLHFFNPVAKMMLVEIIRSRQTRDDVVEDMLAFTRKLDKLPLPCRSAPGFVVNRILMPYMTEAMLAADEGVPLALIDRIATQFGMPMGPIELADTVGLDVAAHVGKILAEAYARPTPKSTAALVAAGRLGRKSGQGFYEWRDGKPVKPAAAGELPADLEDRLILQYLNEAVACLREQVIDDADLLDAGMIFGTGFAPFRGGPLHYARARGAAAIVARLEQLATRYGPRFRPDSGWASLAAPR
ncbi:MAG: 3-hydroxyacyl-CoA dehydrogenase / enoyl-CoA hydratase / 3-hydroxybutyryl-CoA epimerase [Steroidobacteraceae bacterium]|nr:3-hydroxyacyl-CoA dehydrogenase / enoyl-CoA hydratase / 3-hydroxybutyryl-CoA epimerase [Steroidobacteraceae bacterium]